MSKCEFVFLDKQKKNELLPELFGILHSNMSLIAPTGNPYDEDLRLWSSCIMTALEAERRQIVLMRVDGALAGYFQYYIDEPGELLMIEEVQLSKEYQGSLLLYRFCRWFALQLPADISYLAAYAHKKNLRSQNVIRSLGLTAAGENKNGNSYYYKGGYAPVFNKFHGGGR